MIDTEASTDLVEGTSAIGFIEDQITVYHDVSLTRVRINPAGVLPSVSGSTASADDVEIASF